MSNETQVGREMPKYQSHKQVWALKIAEIKRATPSIVDPLGADFEITPAEEGYGPIVVTQAYVGKHMPTIGGYYVVYADGYASFSPAEAFEAGNTRIGGDNTITRVAHREITAHCVNPVNDAIKCFVMDMPSNGGANHEYHAVMPNGNAYRLNFQMGGIKEVGVNGLTHELLLAVLVDRLDGFQSGPFACKETGQALALVESALQILHGRTKERMARGVEGIQKS